MSLRNVPWNRSKAQLTVAAAFATARALASAALCTAHTVQGVAAQSRVNWVTRQEIKLSRSIRFWDVKVMTVFLSKQFLTNLTTD
jgi:hypothetical protein